MSNPPARQTIFGEKIKILNIDNLISGHRQADMAASLRVQGQRQSCLTHTSRQGDAGTSQTDFLFPR